MYLLFKMKVKIQNEKGVIKNNSTKNIIYFIQTDCNNHLSLPEPTLKCTKK